MTACSGDNAPPETTTAADTPVIVANAGPDQSVFTGTFVTLNGSKSTNANGTGLTYSWSLNKPAASNAALSNPAAANPTFRADLGGTYDAILTVSDAQNVSVTSSPDTVIVIASGTNPPPTGDAGSNQNVFVNRPVVLNGGLSKDKNDDALTFTWHLIGAPKNSRSTLFDSNTVAPSFTPDVVGRYIAELIVHDRTSTSTPASVTITASNKPKPTAVAGSSPMLYFRLNTSSVTLDGSKSHTNPQGGELTYTWTFNSPNPAPALIDADKPFAHFSPPPNVADTYVAQLKLTEKNHPGPEPDFDLDTVSVTLGPLASVEAFLLTNLTSPILTCNVATCDTATIPVGATIQLDGEKSHVQPLTYLWKITNPLTGATLTNPTSAKPTFKPTTAASGGTMYALELKVTDKGNNSNTRPFTITAKNGPAVTIAITPPTSRTLVPAEFTVSLFPTSTDTSLVYLWEFSSRPPESNASFVDMAAQSTTFTTDKSGDYGVKLTVTDTSTTPITKSLSTRIIPANNLPNAVITAPSSVNVCSTVNLSGSGSTDPPDGTISSYTWSLSSRPPGSGATLSLVPPPTTTTSFKADKPGTYTVNLTVKDNLDSDSAFSKDITASPNTIGQDIFNNGLPGMGKSTSSQAAYMGKGPGCTDCHGPGNNLSNRNLSEVKYTVDFFMRAPIVTGTFHTGTNAKFSTDSEKTEKLSALREYLDSKISTGCP